MCCGSSWWPRFPRHAEDPARRSYTNCEQNTLARHIFSHLHAHILMTHMTWLKNKVCPRTSSHVSSAWCCCLDTLRLSTLHSALSTVSLIFLFILLIFTFIFIFHVGWFEWNKYPAYSRATTSQRPLKCSSRNPLSDYTIGMALSSPLFTQEREEPASRRQA